MILQLKKLGNVKRVIPIVSCSGDIMCNVNHVIPQLITSLADEIASHYTFNKLLVGPTELNDCISCVDTYST